MTPNPTEAPAGHQVGTAAPRLEGCPEMNNCLDVAIRANWKRWSCGECHVFAGGPAEVTPTTLAPVVEETMPKDKAPTPASASETDKNTSCKALAALTGRSTSVIWIACKRLGFGFGERTAAQHRQLLEALASKKRRKPGPKRKTKSSPEPDPEPEAEEPTIPVESNIPRDRQTMIQVGLAPLVNRIEQARAKLQLLEEIAAELGLEV